MTIRFAPARNRDNLVSVVTRGFGYSVPKIGANDNGLVAANDDPLLTETLRHFAEHGLRAAERARDKAMDARRAGDSTDYEWWLSICRMLNRRMADAVAAEPVSGA